MGKNKNSLKNLKPFQNGDDDRRNKKGRPKKLLHLIIRDLKKQGYQRVGASQIADAYEVLLNLTSNELTAKALDKQAPMILRIVAKSMLSGKGFEIIERMMDRVHGKATQPIKVKQTGGVIIKVVRE